MKPRPKIGEPKDVNLLGRFGSILVEEVEQMRGQDPINSSFGPSAGLRTAGLLDHPSPEVALPLFGPFERVALQCGLTLGPGPRQPRPSVAVSSRQTSEARGELEPPQVAGVLIVATRVDVGPHDFRERAGRVGLVGQDVNEHGTHHGAVGQLRRLLLIAVFPAARPGISP